MDKSDADGTLKCHQCGAVTVPDIQEKPFHRGVHLTAYCGACGKFIKNLPQGKLLQEMPFGKHRGKTFADIAKEDRGYLEWLLKADKMSMRIVAAAKEALGE